VSSANNHERMTTYPRAFVALATTIEGRDSQVNTRIVPANASVTRRSHNEAGEAEVTILGTALPFDPRQVVGVELIVMMGDPGRVDGEINDREHTLFIGFADEMNVERDDKGPMVKLKARDFSAIFREFKPIPPEVVPRYSDTIGDAITRIIDATHGSRDANGTPRVTIRPSALLERPLASGVHGRHRSSAIHLEPDMTAWSVIEYVCGLVDVIPSIDLLDVVLRETHDVFDESGPIVASFEFGSDTANLLSVSQSKKFVRNRKGVKVTSYDPTTRRELSAVYPSDEELLHINRPRAHQPSRARRIRPRNARAATNAEGPERDVFPVRGVHSQDGLQRYAERIYTERSRQEIEGKIVTPKWPQEVLRLQNGDRIRITIDPAIEAAVLKGDKQRAVRFLTDRLGMEDDAAAALINATLDRPTSTFYARNVTHEFDAEGVSKTTIEFINLIQVRA
jgi:hypothetical protein